MPESVLCEASNGVATVTLNRPDKANALNVALYKGLVEAGEAIRKNPTIRAVLLRGKGANFCAGIDKASFSSGVLDESLAPRTHGIANLYQQAAMVWHQIEVPVIAVVEGACLGGGLQVISGADIRYVHPDSKMSIRESHWGLVPDMAGTQLWGRYVREDVLRKLTYTAEIFSGEAAGRYGFATEVSEDPWALALDTVGKIINKSPECIKANKRLINNQAAIGIVEGLLAESREQDLLINSPNQIEAVKANLEGRDPIFFEEP